MQDKQIDQLGVEINNYCKKYNIPTEYLFEILEDQKVIPMIRGKALEYNAYLKLKQVLPSNIWDVQKLNLNAQPGTTDEDISITHRRSGLILKVECKSAVRGSISDGKKTRISNVPHYRVKCHRSRSNIKKASTSNDRYAEDEFDLIISTTSNAIYQGKTVGENLEIIYNEGAQKALYSYYGEDTEEKLILACADDYRFCIPADIAVSGFIPRTPLVLLSNDANWKSLDTVNDRLQLLVAEIHKNKKSTSRRT